MPSSYVTGKITYGTLEINEGGKLISESIIFKNNDVIQEEFNDWKAIWFFYRKIYIILKDTFPYGPEK